MAAGAGEAWAANGGTVGKAEVLTPQLRIGVETATEGGREDAAALARFPGVFGVVTSIRA